MRDTGRNGVKTNGWKERRKDMKGENKGMKTKKGKNERLGRKECRTQGR